ncbi:MAG: GTPase ObgE [Candidatus Puniceispirillum sp.]|nr:GTPase ObgE [Candidatus Pelagibacter sp.]MBA4282940.1 GTPase ObgE [Candidatus Puniceispirillum sp.]
MKFLDECKIFIQSGHGGAGCISFRREKFIEYGGPDGGNGGKGGSVYITAVQNLNTLIDFRYKQHFKAQTGHHGMGANRTGPHGEDIILNVPVGTQIFEDDKETLIKDMLVPNETFIILRGGDGGFGNAHYKTSTNQAPRKSTPGWPGEEKWIWLHLKLIADVGLIGLPNAGKSSFLSVATRAKPKIADYPFTTLNPQLGVVSAYDKEFVLADIPGLIEDAHLGHGLGTRFLGHIERCETLIHLIDCTSENIIGDYGIVRKELECYDETLSKKQEIIVLNKSDLLLDEELEEKIIELKKLLPGCTILTCSTATRQGIKSVLEKAYKNLNKEEAL